MAFNWFENLIIHLNEIKLVYKTNQFTMNNSIVYMVNVYNLII